MESYSVEIRKLICLLLLPMILMIPTLIAYPQLMIKQACDIGVPVIYTPKATQAHEAH